MFLAGDSAIGSPYFNRFRSASSVRCTWPGSTQRDLPLTEMLDSYELYSYKEWLRVYMRSKMIKRNKDLFQSLDDPLALLGKLHIY